jgi:hypothetical protein
MDPEQATAATGPVAGLVSSSSPGLAVAIEFLHELNQKRLMDADGMPSTQN